MMKFKLAPGLSNSPYLATILFCHSARRCKYGARLQLGQARVCRPPCPAYCALQNSSVGGIVGHVLRARECLKLLSWEEQEPARKEFEIQVAKRYHMHRSGASGYAKAYAKTKRLGAKLCMANLARNLSKQCHHNAKVHQCKEPFQRKPATALTWRKLWYTLSKQDRFLRLVQLYSAERKRQAGETVAEHSKANDGLCMHFFVLGHKVCREAFIQITGISSEILQAARRASDQENNASALVLLTPLRNEGRDLK